MSLGGIGAISVLSNIVPKDIHNIINEFFNGNIYASSKLQLKAIPLIKALFSETNPIPIKSALNMLGFSVGIPRLPLIEMSLEGKKLLKKELDAYIK